MINNNYLLPLQNDLGKLRACADSSINSPVSKLNFDYYIIKLRRIYSLVFTIIITLECGFRLATFFVLKTNRYNYRVFQL